MNKTNQKADIALLLEGSYPFIFGGVSSWVHQIIQNFPQYQFALIFLGGSPENYPHGIRYELPENVSELQVYYLFDEIEPPLPKIRISGNKEGFGVLKDMHKAFQCPYEQNIGELPDITDLMNDKHGVSYEQFLFSKESWDYIVDEYTAQCEDDSFIDYFWTIKNLHQPLWKLFHIIENIPEVKLVHTVSTGYAGFLSYFLNIHKKYPVVLTEHGIYTRERKVDIFLSQVFRDDQDRELTEASYLRNLWDRYFKTLARLSYQAADPIVSLFSHAHTIQIEEGADPEKTLIIANGIDIERFKKLRRPLEEKLPLICFIGRLVPVKDVKGFIRAVPNIHQHLPYIKVCLIGSTDQDPEYAEECYELVENMLMKDTIEFQLHQPMENILPATRLLVLSGIREGMPLVILESMAAGVPVVATDVGACRELITGMEGNQFGPAGKIVPVADTRALEKAIIEILTDDNLWKSMSQAAILRAEKYYDEKLMIDKYRNIYERIIR